MEGSKHRETVKSTVPPISSATTASSGARTASGTLCSVLLGSTSFFTGRGSSKLSTRPSSSSPFPPPGNRPRTGRRAPYSPEHSAAPSSARRRILAAAARWLRPAPQKWPSRRRCSCLAPACSQVRAALLSSRNEPCSLWTNSFQIMQTQNFQFTAHPPEASVPAHGLSGQVHPLLLLFGRPQQRQVLQDLPRHLVQPHLLKPRQALERQNEVPEALVVAEAVAVLGDEGGQD